MEINVQTIRFEATDKLQDYIQKRISKLDKFSADIKRADITLKLVKPETAVNKHASLRLVMPGAELFTEKTCDTFEEALDLCAETVLRQLQKYKETQKKR